MFQEPRQAFRFKLRLYGKAAICGITTWIFVGFDTLLPSGKRFYFLQRGNHTACVLKKKKKHMGGIFYEWNWNKIMHEHMNPFNHRHIRTHACTHAREHVTSKVETKQIEFWVWDIVFLSVKGANLKNKSPVWGKWLPIFTQHSHSLPLVNSCRRPSA